MQYLEKQYNAYVQRTVPGFVQIVQIVVLISAVKTIISSTTGGGCVRLEIHLG